MEDKTNSSSPPSSFRYRNVYEKGKPTHDRLDSFSVKHPPMDLSRRAKIFSPFDALKGFNEAIISKEQESLAGSTPAKPENSYDTGYEDDHP